MSGAALAPEDEARANFYALLARLFYAAPDRPLLDALAGAAEMEAESEALSPAWRELKRAAAAADAEQVREEYDAVFVGTGKAEVTLYTGAYTARNPSHSPLAEIREFLSAHGMARQGSAPEPEDHVAALCDVMRHLITRDDTAAQRRFFGKFLAPVAGPLCDAIIGSPRVGFYGPVARLCKSFLALEHSALDMD